MREVKELITRVLCSECGRQIASLWARCGKCGYQMTDDPLDTSERARGKLLHKYMQIETQRCHLTNRLAVAIAWGADAAYPLDGNQDSLLSVVPQDAGILASKGALFVVANGFESIGYRLTHSEQEERISQRAVRELMTSYYQAQEEDPLRALERAVKQANIAIYQAKLEHDHDVVGSTCVALAVCGETVYGMNVGNDRAYLLRHGQAKQRSRDHTLKALMEEGVSPQEQGLHQRHPERIIYRSLGAKDNVEGEMFVESVQGSDIWVLCTGGLHHFVTDEELLRTLIKYPHPGESVKRLILLAKEHGSGDDITAIVIKLSRQEGSSSYRNSSANVFERLIRSCCCL
jgi:PPM family protein phosphatase